MKNSPQAMLTDCILDVLRVQYGAPLPSALPKSSGKAWARALHWMDTSGVALYFLQQAEEQGIANSMPEKVLARLRTNRLQNRERAADLARELRRIGEDLQSAGIRFLVLKGFANVPEACPDPALRLQVDLDLMVEEQSMNRVQDLLKWHGYGMTAIGRGAWEFRTQSASMPRLRDLYAAKRERSLDVHPTPSAAFEKAYASRSQREVLGTRFYAHDAVDRLLAQSKHLAKHMRGEWTRLSWLLEMRTAVRFWFQDEMFWRALETRTADDKNALEQLGVSSLLCRTVLGNMESNPTLRRAEESVHHGVRLWIAEYGRETVLRSFPGSKLYLLIPSSPTHKDKEKQRRLLPITPPPRIMPGGDSGEYHFRAFLAQMRFIAFRLRFHIREGMRYQLTAQRWKRISAQLEERTIAR